MRCIVCGASMHWVGSLTEGGLACTNCVDESIGSHDEHTQMLLDEQILREDGEGGFEAQCCMCHRWTELPVGPDEIDADYEHYCGGSPRCCP